MFKPRLEILYKAILFINSHNSSRITFKIKKDESLLIQNNLPDIH